MIVRRSGTWIAMAVAAMLAGCGLRPDADSRCDKRRPYHTARDMPPLQVPAGADAPDTGNALRIPEVRAPERPDDAGRCLDRPPPYSSQRPPG